MTDETPNVIIPREHQSAPKEHWMNEELRKAAEDLDKGEFHAKLKEDDDFYIGPEQLLWQHPRIVEALEKLKTEVSTSKNPQEYLEKVAMLHELNEMAAQPNKWSGQGRWMGKENEEERMGQLLSPRQFMEKLERVIGTGRIELWRYAVMGRVAVLAPDSSYSSLILNPYAPPPSNPELQGKVQVATLQWPLGTEWMQMAFTEYGIPKYAKYLGWRTALLSLISLRIITEQEAHKAFPVNERTASAWYLAQLYQMRNGGAADA